MVLDIPLLASGQPRDSVEVPGILSSVSRSSTGTIVHFKFCTSKQFFAKVHIPSDVNRNSPCACSSAREEINTDYGPSVKISKGYTSMARLEDIT